jgi:hypothetical protein
MPGLDVDPALVFVVVFEGEFGVVAFVEASRGYFVVVVGDFHLSFDFEVEVTVSAFPADGVDGVLEDVGVLERVIIILVAGDDACDLSRVFCYQAFAEWPVLVFFGFGVVCVDFAVFDFFDAVFYVFFEFVGGVERVFVWNL